MLFLVTLILELVTFIPAGILRVLIKLWTKPAIYKVNHYDIWLEAKMYLKIVDDCKLNIVIVIYSQFLA